MKRFSHLSSDGSTTLAAYCTACESPVAMVQISHGMCENFSRYEAFAKFLSENGFLVFGHDHLGHGASAATPDDLGFISHRDGAEHLVDDVHSLCWRMKEEHPDLPVILLGHSMGSFVARAVLEKYPDTYTAAIIMGTAGPDMPTAAGKLLAHLVIALRGERYRSRLLRSISFAGYTKRCGKDCDPNAWLTRDPAVVARYNAEPLCGFVFTARAYSDLFTLLGGVSRRAWAEKIRRDLPLLLVSGEEDPVGGWGKGVKKIAERLKHAGVQDLTLSLYPGMRHEILNELSYETVWSDLLQWMKRSVM